uniref:Putative terminase n=1 Tax=viral metagenome TaxID=1070528 RepID=A0A6M3KHW5_9ZZZZ
MPKNGKLTLKQQSFVKQYVIFGGNGTKAYQESEYANCIDTSAASEACKLLKKPIIIEAVAREQKKAMKKVDSSLERTLQEIVRVAYSDLTPFIDSHDGSVKDLSTLPADVRAAIQGIQVITAYAKGGDKIIKHKITRDDKNRALDMLMRYHGAYEADNRQKQIDIEGVVKTILDVIKSLPGPDATRIMAGIEGKIGLITEKAD